MKIRDCTIPLSLSVFPSFMCSVYCSPIFLARVTTAPMVPIGYVSMLSANCLIVVFGMKVYSLQIGDNFSTRLDSSREII